VTKGSRRAAPPTPLDISVVRSVDDLMQVFCVRSIVYMSEQTCPHDEEFDGNDLAGATHLIARRAGEPVGTVRLRWFSGFAKFERMCVRRECRGAGAAEALLRRACEIAARKGYRKVLVHAQEKRAPHWRKIAAMNVRRGRPRFSFSDVNYVEMELELPADGRAIDFDTRPMVLLRPEGAWDEPGVLDRSMRRQAGRAP
jgi:predicted GNAT family N-acyltransferase